MASAQSPWSRQARQGRPFWGNFNNIFLSDTTNPFCNPFCIFTHLSAVKSQIQLEEGLTSSQHASLLSPLTSASVAKHRSVYFRQKIGIPRCQCVPQLFTFSSILFGNDAVVLGSIPVCTTAISGEVARRSCNGTEPAERSA